MRTLPACLLAGLLAALAVVPSSASARTPRPRAHARGVKASIALGDKRPPRARLAQAPACAGTDLAPTAANLDAVRAAVLCLHNRVREENGLPPLRENPLLERAAAGHAASMVADGFFSHTTPGGSTFVDRILAAGYVRPDQAYALGENLAWGTGSLATPESVVRTWMSSPEHRANILRRSYREIGLGVAPGVPAAGDGDAAGATFAADFGVRR